MNGAIAAGVQIIVAIIGVAILAVLVSKNANTAGVLQAGGQSLSGVLGTALSPVTGNGLGLNSSGFSSNFNHF